MSGHHNLPSRKTRTPAEIEQRDARDRLQAYVKCHSETRVLFNLWRTPGPEAWTKLRLDVFGDNPQAVLGMSSVGVGVLVRTYLRLELAARGESVAI